MLTNGINSILKEIKIKLEESYDLWQLIPRDLQNEFEYLFENNQGVAYHIYRATENLDDISEQDINKICESYGSIIINDECEFNCSLHDTPRNSEWCEENCERYYNCDTIAWVGDECKIIEKEF